MFTERDSAMVQLAVQGLQKGVEALTPAAKHVYALAIRQSIIQGCIDLALLTTATVGAVMLIKQGFKFHAEDDYKNESSMMASWMIGGLLALVSAICWLADGGNILARVFNPEWAALQMLAGLVQR